MDQKITAKVVKAGLSYIAGQLSTDGGLMGLASNNPDNFDGARVHPTIFFSALALGALANVPGSNNVQGQLARFLIRQKSPDWTWNYWVRDNRAQGLRTYPDDLDDTACAASALAAAYPGMVGAAAKAKIATALVACEQTAGGPYKTWLIGGDAPAIWHDVDVAVNANIGFMLSFFGVQLAGLDAYIAEALAGNNLESTYYVGRAPVLYFIARWYKSHDCLRAIEREIAAHRQTDNPLTLSLLLSAACNAGVSRKHTEPLLRQLMALRRSHYWPARALYFEPAVNSVPQYAGSAALTTAFALEAVSLYMAQNIVAKPAKVFKVSNTLRIANQTSHNLSDLMGQHYRSYIGKVSRGTQGPQIYDIATIMAGALDVNLPDQQLMAFNLASLNGWIAYTIYDDFLDNEARPLDLGVANFALRQSVHYFGAALPYPDFEQYVRHTLMRVDEANTWEVAHARNLSELPNYADYQQLADRSWGHVLAATGVLLAAGYLLGGREVRRFHTFFRHFLIAKQLGDDAHDWQADLQAERVTAVVVLLRQQTVTSDPAELQEVFWTKVMPQVNRIMLDHIKKAQRSMAACDFIQDPGEFAGWLWALRRSVEASESGIASAQEFIKVFH